MGIIEIYKKSSNNKKIHISGIKITKKSRVYVFKGNIGREKLLYIAENILIDPVVEDFSIGLKKKDKELDFIIFLKDNVLDVEGKRIKELLRFLNIRGVKEVKFGRRYSAEGKNRVKILNILSRNLYNPVIEKITFL